MFHNEGDLITDLDALLLCVSLAGQLTDLHHIMGWIM